jgi:hypothetical protein
MAYNTHKVMKKVKDNRLSGGKGDDHLSELERIRHFSNMEKAFPEEHFDAQTYNFDSKTVIQPDLRKKKPYSKSTEDGERDDTHVTIGRTVSFPVRKKMQK